MTGTPMTARVWATCKHHPARRLACWGIDESGALHILDTAGLALEPVDGWSERGPAWVPAAGAGATSQNYAKWAVRCTAPSCNYLAEVGQASQSRVADLLAGLVDAGIPEHEVELNELLRGLSGRATRGES